MHYLPHRKKIEFSNSIAFRVGDEFLIQYESRIYRRVLDMPRRTKAENHANVLTMKD